MPEGPGNPPWWVMADHKQPEPVIAWDREETEPCEKGTPGCSIKHPDGPETDCETW